MDIPGGRIVSIKLKTNHMPVFQSLDLSHKRDKDSFNNSEIMFFIIYSEHQKKL